MQFSGTEAVSQPFAFELTIATKDNTLNLAFIVGQPLTLAVLPGRMVSGMVERIEQVDGDGSEGLYKVRLVPSMSRTKYRVSSRSFSNINPINLAAGLMSEVGVTNVEQRVTTKLPNEELIVQYQESDFALMSRILEAAGVHYHFEMTESGDKMVLSDTNTGFPISPVGRATMSSKGAVGIVSFFRGQSMHSGSVEAGDYNWKMPSADLSATAQVTVFSDLTERVFPAGADAKSESQVRANIRLASRIAEAQICKGESTYPQLGAGQRVLLTGHPRQDFNQEYVIVGVEHEATGKRYRNTFRCIPSQIQYRPPLATPIPIIAGVVSGIVVGPAGETKFVDKYGRVKVRFPWRSPAHSDATDLGDAGFVRVAQIAAGAGTAALWIPEVGEEVLVAFEHGDPGRPVIVGSVYNGGRMPPVSLPANRHVSLLRGQAASGGKTELVYDATPGNERLLVQSGPNSLTLATNGVAIQGQSLAVQTQGSVALTAGAAMQVQGGTDLVNQVGRNMSLVAGKDLAVKAGLNYSAIVGRDASMAVGEDLAIQTGKSLVTQSGGLFKFVTAQTGTIEARGGLFLRSPVLVSIESKDISVKASANLIMKGAKITQN